MGITTANMGELIAQVERGFSFNSLRKLETHSGMPISMIAAIIGIPERTLARRKTAGKLTSGESERLLRLSTVFEKAVELFEGDVEAAVKWLTTSQKLRRSSNLNCQETGGMILRPPRAGPLEMHGLLEVRLPFCASPA